MKNIAITIFIVLLITIVGLKFVCFQVRETESALVRRLGKPVREIKEPGLYFKWPDPIERKEKFDSRKHVLESEPMETTTKGAQPIIVKSYAVWRISEPLEFSMAHESLEEAQTKLRSYIKDTQNKVVGTYWFSDFVNSDPAKIKFERIQQDMLGDLKQSIPNDYGLEVVDLGIKQLKISEEVSKDVFERMRAERTSQTTKIVAEGESIGGRIRDQADRTITELLATAEAKAMVIRAEGEAEAAQYYKELEAEPEFAMFLREIEALKKILEEGATFLVPIDEPPFNLIRQAPNLRPQKQ